MKIDGKTRTCGLIGNPVEHSMSPVMHNFMAKELELAMAYVTFHVQTGDLENAIKGAYALNILGCNVTVPYKSDVIAYLKETDSLAEKIGAVNTLVRVDGGYKGYNTDISGLFRAMKEEGIDLSKEEVIILGAGGVGRAVAYMCAANHAKKVMIFNRTAEKAEQLAKEINEKLETDVATGYAMEAYKNLSGENYLAIQSTNVGMYPHNEHAVIEDEAFYKKIKTGYDLIFNPWETKFMKLVKAQGGQAYNGLKMLLYQGVDAFELWNDCAVPTELAQKAYELMKETLLHG